MTTLFDCEITYLDGSTQIIKNVTNLRLYENCLHLSQRSSFGLFEEHLGSWPLTSIRKWKKHENS